MALPSVNEAIRYAAAAAALVGRTGDLLTPQAVGPGLPENARSVELFPLLRGFPSVRIVRFAVFIATCVLIGTTPASAQAPDPGPLPGGELFRPLIADPKQPTFFAAYLLLAADPTTDQLGTIGLGRTFGLVQWEPGWQLGVDVAVFSQFNMQSRTYDLINTDYLIGFPVTYRRGDLALRARVYHQSSHLGDEFLLHTQARRVDLTFESAELLVSRDLGRWRVYGGGEYLLVHPADLRPGVLHGGVEYRPAAALVRLGRFGDGRVMAALDAKSFESRAWAVAASGRVGLDFGRGFTPGEASPHWSVQLQGYAGPSPYGQFYGQTVSSLGIGIYFDL
jgi:uncharacterized protein DUF1207